MEKKRRRAAEDKGSIPFMFRITSKLVAQLACLRFDF